MAKDVKIPVRVEGADKAQAELKKTGQAVKGVGDAGKTSATGTRAATSATEKHAAAQKKSGTATKQSAQAVNQFDDSAKTAITGILGQFNPALASMANIGVDIAKGIKNVSGALLGMIGLGAGIALIVTIFQKIAEKAAAAEAATKRYLEALRKMRDEALSFQEKVSGAVRAAGQVAPVQPIATYAQQLMAGERMPADLAIFGAVGRQLGGLTDAQVRQLVAGYVYTGEETRFGKKPAENQRIIRELLKAGAAPEAERGLRTRIANAAAQTKRELIDATAFEAPAQWREALIDALKKRGRYSERELEIIARLAEEPTKPTVAGMRRAWELAVPSATSRVWRELMRILYRPSYDVSQLEMEPGGAKFGQLVTEAAWIHQQGERMPGALRGGESVGVPPIIYINAPTTNMGVVYDSMGMVQDAFRADPDLMSGPMRGAP